MIVMYQNKYRVESIRWKDWDYTNPWWYFVTINTKKHIEFFGEIIDERMILNDLGIIAEKFWKDIPWHFPHIEIDQFILMPNHLHGILNINPITNYINVETPDRASLRKSSLGQIINQYKGSVKRWANKNGFEKLFWQSRYYDRIIRDEKELDNIRIYIKDNPSQWEIDKNHPENRDLP